MNRDCQVTDKGDVYEIQSDGSISKIGNIHHSRDNNGWLWFFLIVAIIASIILGICYDDAEKSLRSARRKASDFERQYNSAQQDIRRLNSDLQEANRQKNQAVQELNDFKANLRNFPLLISDIEIGNQYANGATETSYGGYIYSSRSMYLAPKIKYVGLNSGYATLKVKFYTPDGTLSKGSSSPYDCSYTNSMYVYSGKNEYSLSSWGGSSMGHWRKGSYRIEVWYNSTCLAVKNFTIY